MPKLIIASDGEHTRALLDGVLIGQGIERLDFSTQDKNGDMKSTIRIMDLNVSAVEVISDKDKIQKFLNSLQDKPD